jgi:hypothetical protein
MSQVPEVEAVRVVPTNVQPVAVPPVISYETAPSPEPPEGVKVTICS